MRNKIAVNDREHLIELIGQEIEKKGYRCSLNHLDVTNVKNMSELFYSSKFNGDISQWDVSNVQNMNFMFTYSKFNGDISNWNVSKVKGMHKMFTNSTFNQDISKWKPFNLEDVKDMFIGCSAPIPYWAMYENKENIIIAINNYYLNKELKNELIENGIPRKKMKI